MTTTSAPLIASPFEVVASIPCRSAGPAQAGAEA
jgi:hypothetical protein